MQDKITTGGLSMPKLGFGTFRIQGDDCRGAVESALALGYRHIDTAEMYGNEESVGAALASSGIGREDIHLTTKVWMTHLAPDAMRRAIEASLSALRTDHVDLYLVHWPSPDMDLAGVMRTLAALKEQGLARQVGVSNFTLGLLRRAVDELQAPIVCNQLEYHVMLAQSKLLSFMRGRGLALTAYAPLAKGEAADQPVLIEIARKHGATPAQVALKWLLDQDDVAAIPKASRPQNQRANLEALSLSLDDEDRAAIAALPKDRRFVSPDFAPVWDTP